MFTIASNRPAIRVELPNGIWAEIQPLPKSKEDELRRTYRGETKATMPVGGRRSNAQQEMQMTLPEHMQFAYYTAYALESWKNWGGLADEQGNPLPLNKENLMRVAEHYWAEVFWPLVDAFEVKREEAALEAVEAGKN